MKINSLNVKKLYERGFIFMPIHRQVVCPTCHKMVFFQYFSMFPFNESYWFCPSCKEKFDVCRMGEIIKDSKPHIDSKNDLWKQLNK